VRDVEVVSRHAGLARATSLRGGYRLVAPPDGIWPLSVKIADAHDIASHCGLSRPEFCSGRQ